MTQDELDAIPELPNDFGVRTIERDGKKIMVPVAPDMRVLWQEEDDPRTIEDQQGRVWMVGILDGKRVKRRLRDLEGPPWDSLSENRL